MVADQLKWISQNLTKKIKCNISDFSKAFDLVDHQTFLEKLFNIGLDKRSVMWVSSFLSSQQDKVKIGSFFSYTIYISIGVLQYGHYSPLFCNLFSKSIFTCFLDSDSLLLTDDFKAYRIINSLYDQKRLQDDLCADWCPKNKLNLNVDKCCIIFSKIRNNSTLPIH